MKQAQTHKPLINSSLFVRACFGLFQLFGFVPVRFGIVSVCFGALISCFGHVI